MITPKFTCITMNTNILHDDQEISLGTSHSETLTPLVCAKNITCIRQDRLLFEALDLTVNAGEIVQIEGTNGSGKTSLLRILAGLSQPYEGDVFFNSTNIKHTRDDFNQNVFYLGHLAGIKGEMTAEENLTFSLTLQGLHAKNVEQTLKNVNLFGFEDSLASQLSAGQHRRIALAQLWETNAPIWILDEPFTAIDKQGVKTLETLLLTHVDNGGCVILTTHQDLTFAKNRITKVVLHDQHF